LLYLNGCDGGHQRLRNPRILSVAEIEYNNVKPAIHFWLLTLQYQPFVASTIASFITIIRYLAVADSMAYLTCLFKKPGLEIG
jgi:hypothetical protein